MNFIGFSFFHIFALLDCLEMANSTKYLLWITSTTRSHRPLPEKPFIVNGSSALPNKKYLEIRGSTNEPILQALATNMDPANKRFFARPFEWTNNHEWFELEGVGVDYLPYGDQALNMSRLIYKYTVLKNCNTRFGFEQGTLEVPWKEFWIAIRPKLLGGGCHISRIRVLISDNDKIDSWDQNWSMKLMPSVDASLIGQIQAFLSQRNKYDVFIYDSTSETQPSMEETHWKLIVFFNVLKINAQNDIHVDFSVLENDIWIKFINNAGSRTQILVRQATLHQNTSKIYLPKTILEQLRTFWNESLANMGRHVGNKTIQIQARYGPTIDKPRDHGWKNLTLRDKNNVKIYGENYILYHNPVSL